MVVCSIHMQQWLFAGGDVFFILSFCSLFVVMVVGYYSRSSWLHYILILIDLYGCFLIQSPVEGGLALICNSYYMGDLDALQQVKIS